MSKLVSSKLLAIAMVAGFLFVAVIPVSAAGESITISKDTVKANIQFRVNAAGLTAATQYTLYAGSTLKVNKSTAAGETTLVFKITVGASLVGTLVTITLRNVSGDSTLASTTVAVEDIIEQATVDMIGGLIPFIMAISVVFVAIFVLPRKIGDALDKM